MKILTKPEAKAVLNNKWSTKADVDEFYSVRIRTDRKLLEDDAAQMFSCVAYAFTANFRGEPMGEPIKIDDYNWMAYYDITKSRSDDWLAHLEDALAAAREFVINGTPVRKTTSRHGQKGTRALEGIGPVKLEFFFN